MNRPAVRAPAAASGFTLIELIVVMGILSGFLIMLVQLVDVGLRLFGDGELGQALADRSSRAQRVIGDELRTLRGGPSDRGAPDDRLVVQLLPIGLPPRPEPNPTLVQVLRGAVHLAPDRELALVEAMLMARFQDGNPSLKPAELERLVAEAKEKEPLRGIGNLLLLPWRQEQADDAMLELRCAWLLPGQKIPVDRDRFVDPFAVVVPGGSELPAVLVEQITVPLLKDLLHVEFAFWSQRTRDWGRDGLGGGGMSGGTGPELIWDSARGGWLDAVASGGVFAFDRGPQSLGDASDDIQPHSIRVRCVVAQPPERAPEGLLAEPIDAEAQGLALVNGDRFPGDLDGGWIKVRGEWLHYSAREGDLLRGLRRGQRGTKAIEHPAGARVQVGRSVEFVIPLPHAKDDWNG